ncbi:MAG: outer membrane beta-barrel protein [Helicobacteraceae bacterium]|nr:outer membrane beta-barrel protein [Helicobacteraceae bacterium]
MMKFTKALLATAVLSSGVMATEGGVYAGGGLAFEAVPNNSQNWEMGMAVVLRGGMTLDAVLENFAVEAELTKSVVDPKVNYKGDTSRDKINVTTLATYAVYRIPITDKIYVKPRFGIIFPNLGGAEYDGSNDNVVNSRDVTFSSGIGGGFTVMNHLDVYVDYTVIGESITNYGAGVEYHF